MTATIEAPAAPMRLPEWVLQLEPAELLALRDHLHPMYHAALEERLTEVAGPETWTALEHQRPPDDDNWFGFLLMGGRGIGKTATITHLMDEHANGPACLPGKVPHRMGIIAPTHGDASASVVHGDDGLMTINPSVEMKTMDGYRVVQWPNGSFAYLFGVSTRNDVDRLRARGNRCFDAREEIAAWRWLKDAQAQANLGLRKGKAQWVGATTPRPRPTIRALNTDPLVRVNKAQTDDNPHLAQDVRDRLYEMYENTRLGLQELGGEILDDVEGALWNQELIERNRVTVEDVPRLVRVRTYVDPSWGTTNDECGIIVAGLGVDRHLYILADLSKRTTPLEWGLLAALGWIPEPEARYEAQQRAWNDGKGNAYFSERVVAETNFQAEQVRLNMMVLRLTLGRRVPFSKITASQGKRIRSEPVVGLYEQDRVHHVGTHMHLEFQMTTWVPPTPNDTGDERDTGDPVQGEGEEESEWSPDRLDAAVFAAHDLILGEGFGVGVVHVAAGEIPTTSVNTKTARSRGPKIGNIPAATRQGRLAAQQLKGKHASG